MNQLTELINNIREIRIRINEQENKQDGNIFTNIKRKNIIKDLKEAEKTLNNQFMEQVNSVENTESIEFQLNLYGKMIAETTNILHVEEAKKTVTEGRKVHLFRAIQDTYDNAASSLEGASIAMNNDKQSEYTIAMAKYKWFRKDLETHNLSQIEIADLNQLEKELEMSSKRVI